MKLDRIGVARANKRPSGGVLAACQQTAPIYDPPPGGHDSLSQPPASLTAPHS